MPRSSASCWPGGEYGIGGEQLEILTQLADPRGAFGWHRDYDDLLHGAWKDYLLLETAAARIWTYEAQRIPAPAADPGLRPRPGRRRCRAWSKAGGP